MTFIHRITKTFQQKDRIPKKESIWVSSIFIYSTPKECSTNHSAERHMLTFHRQQGLWIVQIQSSQDKTFFWYVPTALNLRVISNSWVSNKAKKCLSNYWEIFERYFLPVSILWFNCWSLVSPSSLMYPGGGVSTEV